MIGNSRRRRKIEIARNKTGYLANGPEKQLTRQLLIEAAESTLPQAPAAIFTFPGMMGFCVEAFRNRWPRSRIVGIDRQQTSARLTKAHLYPRILAAGQIQQNDIFAVGLEFYTKRQRDRMWRYLPDGKKFRASEPHRLIMPFDFPRFDLVFLDLTMMYNNEEGLFQAATFIDEHCASLAVVGVTFVLGRKGSAEIDILPIIEHFRRKISRPTRLAREPMTYVTNVRMLFFVLEIHEGD